MEDIRPIDIASIRSTTPESECDTDENQEGLLELFGTKDQQETLKDVVLGTGLSKDQNPSLTKMLRKHANIFNDLPRNVKEMEYSIQLISQEPVRPNPYGLPYRETLKGDIDDMLKMGVIRPSTSPYASPTVVAKKI